MTPHPIPPQDGTCVDGPDGVFLSLQEGHQGHHDTHGAGQGLLRAIAGVDGLARLAQHEDVLPVQAPGVHGYVLLLLP